MLGGWESIGEAGEWANGRMGEGAKSQIGKSANRKCAGLSAKGIEYAYDGHAALRGVSFEAGTGEFVR